MLKSSGYENSLRRTYHSTRKLQLCDVKKKKSDRDLVSSFKSNFFPARDCEIRSFRVYRRLFFYLFHRTYRHIIIMMVGE